MQRSSAALAGTRRHPTHLALEHQFVARADLTTEAGTIEPAEQREFAGEPVVVRMASAPT